MSSVIIKSADKSRIMQAVESYIEQLRAAHPEVQKVIWFGSWITGMPTPGSDVDLCLVLSKSPKRMRDRIQDYLPVGFPVGVDLFPYTEEELNELSKRSPGWYQAIMVGREIPKE